MRLISSRSQRWCLLLATLWSLYSPPTASAETPTDPSVWYGWQNLSVDGAAVLLIASGAVVDSFEGRPSIVPGLLFGVGSVSLVLTSPIVHWVHGNVGLGLASLGLRGAASLLALLGLVGRAAQCGDREAEGLSCDAGEEYFILGGLVGIVTIAMDGALGTESDTRERTRGGLRPSVTFTQRQAWLGVRGTF